MPYEGPNLYEPSEWVREVVGARYRGYDPSGSGTRVYECFGYDRRAGFWLRTVDGGEPRTANVSERAIGSTYHKIHMSWGAEVLLKMASGDGNVSVVEQKAAESGITIPTVIRTLLELGYIDTEKNITPSGRKALEDLPA